MANIRLIKRRIRSADNISQITKAMELVAASKMKKAQDRALSGRLYADKIYTMVMRLASSVDVSKHPLLKKPKESTGKRLVILVSTNKGLCGGLNTGVFRFITQIYKEPGKHDWISLGNKGTFFLTSMNVPLKADFSQKVPWTDVVASLTEYAINWFVEGIYNGVDLVYNSFISAIHYKPVKKSILPLVFELPKDRKEEEVYEFLIEPEPEYVFKQLLPHYVENQIRDEILEAEASEHCARMIAMRNATDNANSLISDLTLVYNKARQEKITYEISDIVTARITAE